MQPGHCLPPGCANHRAAECAASRPGRLQDCTALLLGRQHVRSTSSRQQGIQRRSRIQMPMHLMGMLRVAPGVRRHWGGGGGGGGEEGGAR